VEQTLVKPAFTQSREVLHHSRLAGRPLEKSAGARMTSISLRHRSPMNKGANCLAEEDERRDAQCCVFTIRPIGHPQHRR